MRRLFAILFSAVLLFTSCIKEKVGGSDLNVGDILPEFTVTLNDGSTVGTQQLKEGVSFIMFFTTACPDCRQTLPHVQKIYDEFAPKGVSFAIISREEGSESIAEYWLSEGLAMPYSAQSDRSVYELFAQSRVPRVYINKDGFIKAIFTDIPANPTYEDMKAVIENL